MALIRSGSVGTESPYLQYELYADQTGGSVNNRTIKITLKVKISSGYYGYPANWRANINGTWSGWMRLKGTESWNKNDGFRTFEYSATTDVGTTSSKAITVGFGIDGYGGDDTWDSTVTGSFTVGATNRPPNPPSNIIVRNGNSANSPVLSAGIVPENITTLYITWSAGSDPDGDQLTYALNESINNGGYVQRDFGTDLAHSYNTNGWDEGGTIRFYVDARDTKGAWSNKTYSGVFTKNRLTAGTIYEYSNNINFNTKSFEARFRGGSNTDKSAVTYSCYSDSITIYNQTYTSDTKQKILIWRTGDATPASNQPYIKFNELVELYRSNNFTGTLSIGLFSKNIHGTKKSTVAAVVQVDLRVAPVAPSSVSITGGKAKKTIAGSTVYLPNGTDDITFSWKASTNPLNAPFSYDLYEVYNGEATKITTVGSNITSYSYVRPPQLNDVASLAFKVVAITSYGYSSEKTSNQIRLEYYNPPTISIGEISRKDTSASVNAIIKINTSIPSVQGTGTWECSNNQKGNITTSSNNINITNLKSDSTYSLIILYNDNSGLSTSRRESISIGKNLPIFSINKFGVGVNGYEADNNYATKIKGGMDIIRTGDGASLLHFGTERGWAFKQGGTGAGTSLDLVSDTTDKSFRIMPPSKNKGISFTVSDTASSSISIDGNNVYHTGRKPTPADIGAAPASHSHSSIVMNNCNNRDLNTIKTAGFYYGYTGMTNAPIQAISVLEVLVYNADWVVQRFTVISNGGKKYERHFYSGTTWSGWRVIYDSSNKPSPADIGALSLGGGNLNGDLIINNNKRLKITGRNTTLETGAGDNDVFIHNTKSGSYLQFHNNSNLYINSLLVGTQTYPIIDRDTNRWWQKIAPVMSDGVIEIGRYIDFHKSYSDGADYTTRLDANGNVLWCSSSIAQGSDRALKENIKYLDDEPALITTEEESSSTLFKDFIKDFKFATYNYKGSEGRCFGFIAQDIAEHPVSKLLLQEHEMDVINKETREIEGTETTLAYNLADYTSVVAKALQEEIIEKDEKIIELKTELKQLRRDYEKQQKQLNMIIGKLGL